MISHLMIGLSLINDEAKREEVRKQLTNYPLMLKLLQAAWAENDKVQENGQH